MLAMTTVHPPEDIKHRAQAASLVSAAVVGTGSIGSRHLHVLRDLIKVPTWAIPVRAQRLIELSENGFQSCETLEAAVASGVRGVIIATDTSRHLTDLSSALGFGCSALVEKPLAATASGLGAVSRQLLPDQQRVYVACDLRFDRSLLHFRERLAEIGPVHAVRIECQSYLPDWRPDRNYRESYSARANEGGVLLDLIHEIDYAVWLHGAPTQVFARLNNTGRLGIAAEESADLYWETAEGASISIRLDYVTRSTHRTMRAYGGSGEIAWDGVAQSVSLETKDRGVEQSHFPQDRNATMHDEDEAFLRTIAGGDPTTLASFEEGAMAVAICDAARRSSVSGKFETVLDWRAS